MKKLLIPLSIILLPFISLSQSYKDTIVTSSYKVIVCEIRDVDKNSIGYTHYSDGSRRPGSINTSDVKYWSWNSNKEEENKIKGKGKSEITSTVFNGKTKKQHNLNEERIYDYKDNPPRQTVTLNLFIVQITWYKYYNME